MAKKFLEFLSVLLTAVFVVSAFLTAPAAIETTASAYLGEGIVLTDSVHAKSGNEFCEKHPEHEKCQSSTDGETDQDDNEGSDGSGGEDTSDGSGSDDNGDGSGGNTVTVCQKLPNGKWNEHPVSANNVDQFIANHPGSYEGKCKDKGPDPEPPAECTDDVSKIEGEWTSWQLEAKTGLEFRWRWLSKVDNVTGKTCSATKQYQHRKPAPQPEPIPDDDDGGNDNDGTDGSSGTAEITTIVGSLGYLPYVHDESTCEQPIVRIDGVKDLFIAEWDGIDVSGTGRPDHWFPETATVVGYGTHVILPEHCDTVVDLQTQLDQAEEDMALLNGDLDRALTEKSELEAKLAHIPEWALAIGDGSFDQYADFWLKAQVGYLANQASMSFEADPIGFSTRAFAISFLIVLALIVLGIAFGASLRRRAALQMKSNLR